MDEQPQNTPSGIERTHIRNALVLSRTTGTVRSSWTSRPDETLNPLPARTAPRAMRARSLPTDRPATPHPFTPDVRACLREQRRARR
jgi:hypothetical protein